MAIISIDPGGTTGIVYWDGRVIRREQTPLLIRWRVLGPEKHHLALWKELTESWQISNGNLQIMCERFDPRQNPAAKRMSEGYIGVVELFYQMAGEWSKFAKPIIWRGPPQKEWATDEKLERMGLLQKPKIKLKDVNDAMRHLVGYICTGDIQGDQRIRDARIYLLHRLKEEE